VSQLSAAANVRKELDMMQSEGRLADVQARLEERNIDLVALGPTSNMHYILGFTPHADERLCVLFISRYAVYMIVPALNLEEVIAHTAIPTIPWDDAEGPQKALQQAREDLGIPHTLAVDPTLRADHLLLLQKGMTPDKTVTTDELLAPLRMLKSAPEIEALANAAAQADRAMQAAIDACYPGTAEIEVAWATESAFRQDGAEQVCFTLIASGPNSAYPHHHSNKRLLQKDDAIIIDISASLNGYKSDITRMVYLGKPTAEFRHVHAAVGEANRYAMAAVQPGVTAEEIDRVARRTLDIAGYGTHFTHRTGHGIGLDLHEPPYIMASNTTILKEGMTFSIEPGVYLTGRFGIRIEDIVVVTQTGVRCLTGFDHSLVIKD
jgi:Xaa-Pro aminopeptidase